MFIYAKRDLKGKPGRKGISTTWTERGFLPAAAGT